MKVSVPATRSDILHSCDVMEDVAIAYGFNNLVPSVPKVLTIGRQQPLNKLTDLLRAEIAMAGYTEVLTLSLVSCTKIGRAISHTFSPLVLLSRKFHRS